MKDKVLYVLYLLALLLIVPAVALIMGTFG